MERSPLLHVGFQALDAFRAAAGRLPAPGDEADAAQVLTLAASINDAAKEKVLRGGKVLHEGEVLHRVGAVHGGVPGS